MRKRVLVTRAAEQAGEFASILEDLGFEPLIFPLIEFLPPKDISKLEEAFDHLSSYDWLLLTSANAVKFFNGYLEERGIDLSSLSSLRVCAVGPKTAEAAEKAGINITLLPDNFQAEGVLDSFQRKGIKGKKILFPRAEEGRDILLKGLAEMGANVNLLPVYRTVKPEGKEGELKKILHQGLEVITFTSGSTVKNFIEILGHENFALLEGVKVACISEVTAKVAKKYSLGTDIIPRQNTTQSLAQAISEYFA